MTHSLALAAAVAVFVAGCAGAAPAPPVISVTPSPTPASSATASVAEHTLTGRYGVPGTSDPTSTAPGMECARVDPAYLDVLAPNAVVVTDQNGMIVGATSLQTPASFEAAMDISGMVPLHDDSGMLIGTCWFRFTIPLLPTATFFYTRDGGSASSHHPVASGTRRGVLVRHAALDRTRVLLFLTGCSAAG